MKKPHGRPTKYKPEYCEQLIKHMAEGLSFETFAAVISVNPDTIYEWAKRHNSFSEAKKIGFNKSQLFWEKLGRSGAAGKMKNFNAASYIYNCKCRFRKSETYGNDPDIISSNTFTISYDPKRLKDSDD